MEIVITDLTYMRKGVCIAGINIKTLENVRPVLSFDYIQRAFITEKKIFPGALVSFDLKSKKPSPPHIEDYIFDPDNTKFVRFLSKIEWTNILNSVCSPMLQYAFNNCIVNNKGILPGSNTSSLTVIKVDRIKINFFDSDIGSLFPFKIRISFVSGSGSYNLPLTDLQFIDYCNIKLNSGFSRDDLKMELEELINDSEYTYLRIGLSRPFKKDEDAEELCYLQVNGIYSDSLDNEIRYIVLNKTDNAVKSKNHQDQSGSLQFKIFNIPIINGEKDMEILNEFLCNVEVKRFVAAVIDNKLWSILVGYVFAPSTSKISKTEKLSCESISELTSEELEIYERLRKWRNNKAQQLNVPEYFIFPNRTLLTMAKTKPRGKHMLLNISGVGDKKINEYGDEVLKIINESEDKM